jgi:pyruvate dehydrogenase E1 component
MAAIIKHGIERMYGNGGKGSTDEDPDVFYYLTIYNENYVQPAKPEGSDEGIVRGLYKWADAPEGPSRKATIVFSGSAQKAAREAQADLAEHFDVAAELWSATSYKALREEALSTERWNRLHPEDEARVPYVAEQLSRSDGPVIAVTDYMKVVPDQVSRWIPEGRAFVPLGTDGFGRSDTREALRRFFETDTANVVVAVLSGLATDGDATPDEVAKAIRHYGIDADAPDPRVS